LCCKTTSTALEYSYDRQSALRAAPINKYMETGTNKTKKRRNSSDENNREQTNQ